MHPSVLNQEFRGGLITGDNLSHTKTSYPHPLVSEMLANINSYKITTHAHQHNHHFNKHLLFNNKLIGISFGSSNYAERRKWLLKCDTTSGNSEVIAIEEEEEGGKRKVYSEIIEEREVLCEVGVVSWRERRIKAQILVFADIQVLWDVLTDYDRLAQFIPNLVTCRRVQHHHFLPFLFPENDVLNKLHDFCDEEKPFLVELNQVLSFDSKRVPCPHPGRIWLEQKGLQRALYWKIEALVLLDLQEFLNSEYEREIHFSLVEGDFEKFEGKWSLKTEMRSQGTTLSYELTVVPKFKIPAIILEKVIRAELPVNLLSVARRAESDSGDNSLPDLQETRGKYLSTE
ncbi:hypothetical protein Leryth_016001 [Lithospermum erythrorhizon]|nr:hypothetical protein Leryth_016001 [Lithospermum erythrorhizon]